MISLVLCANVLGLSPLLLSLLFSIDYLLLTLHQLALLERKGSRAILKEKVEKKVLHQ